MVKNLHANAGDIKDAGSIPGSGRSPGEGNGNPLQCSGLENPMDRGSWWATVHEITNSQIRLKRMGMRQAQKRKRTLKRLCDLPKVTQLECKRARICLQPQPPHHIRQAPQLSFKARKAIIFETRKLSLVILNDSPKTTDSQVKTFSFSAWWPFRCTCLPLQILQTSNESMISSLLFIWETVFGDDRMERMHELQCSDPSSVSSWLYIPLEII